jgi:hypothetical protein
LLVSLSNILILQKNVVRLERRLLRIDAADGGASRPHAMGRPDNEAARPPVEIGPPFRGKAQGAPQPGI